MEFDTLTKDCCWYCQPDETLQAVCNRIYVAAMNSDLRFKDRIRVACNQKNRYYLRCIGKKNASVPDERCTFQVNVKKDLNFMKMLKCCMQHTCTISNEEEEQIDHFSFKTTSFPNLFLDANDVICIFSFP